MFFYRDLCPSCNNWKKIESEIIEISKEHGLYGQFRIDRYNTLHASHARYFDKVINAVAPELENRALPCVVAGNRIIPQKEWGERLAEALRSEIESPGAYPKFVYDAGGDAEEDAEVGSRLYSDKIQPVKNGRDVLYYFYLPLCADCGRAKQALDAFTETYPQYEIESINVSENKKLEMLKGFLAAFDVPEGESSVPIVFFSGGYLSHQQFTYEHLLAARSQIAGDFTVVSDKPPIVLTGSIIFICFLLYEFFIRPQRKIRDDGPKVTTVR